MPILSKAKHKITCKYRNIGHAKVHRYSVNRHARTLPRLVLEAPEITKWAGGNPSLKVVLVGDDICNH